MTPGPPAAADGRRRRADGLPGVGRAPPRPPSCCVHGLGGSHLSWVQVAPGLAGLGRVLALDLPGFGRSPLADRAPPADGLCGTGSPRFLDATTDGPVILAGNSMGGVVALLQARSSPSGSPASCSRPRSSRYTRGGWPHPLVLGSFAAYDVPRLGEAVFRTRRAAVDPETFVRLGLRMLTVDPSTIPEDVIALQRRAGRGLARPSPRRPTRSSRPLGRSTATCARPSLGARAMSNVRCPVLVIHGRQRPVRPGRLRRGRAAQVPGVARPAASRASATCRRWRRPARWLTEVADWYAAALR